MYIVQVADRAGETTHHPRPTFAEALRLYRHLHRACGTQHYAYHVLNADRMDHDGERFIDGLTDEEREQL